MKKNVRVVGYDSTGKLVVERVARDVPAPADVVVKLAEVIAREGLDMAKAADRERAARLVSAAGAAPLYGERARVAAEMGGEDRLLAFEETLRDHSLHPTRDRAYAFRLMCDSLGLDMQSARTFAEAEYVARRRAGKLVHFGEADIRDASLVVLAERPDLVPWVAASQARKSAVADAERVRLNEGLGDDERERAFDRAIGEELKRRDLPDNDTNRGNVARHLAEMRPDLCPRPGRYGGV